MTDKFSKDVRSMIMSRIHYRDTKPEIKFRKYLWANGFRGYRVNSHLPGKPDVVFTKKSVIIFIDGDFWHGYNWKILRKVPPKGYWMQKIKKNIVRDKSYNKKLKKDGWKVLRFWEHQINDDIDKVLNKIEKILSK